MQFEVDRFTCESCGALPPCTHDLLEHGFLPSRLAHLEDLEKKELLDFFSEADSADIVAWSAPSHLVHCLVNLPVTYLTSLTPAV